MPGGHHRQGTDIHRGPQWHPHHRRRDRQQTSAGPHCASIRRRPGEVPQGRGQDAVSPAAACRRGTTQPYTVLWYPGMSFLNALEQALPAAQGAGSLSLNYFPQYGGYFISAVGGVPAAGVAKYWTTCLLPVGPGSTMITLPLASNKILVGSGDTVILAYDQACPGSSAPH